MYSFVKFLIPYIEKYSFSVSVALFIFWLFQTKSKIYLRHLDLRAKHDYRKTADNIRRYNSQNLGTNIELKSGWFELYKNYYKRTNNTLLLSLMFAYLSFNTTSYFESNDDNFFKLLTISTSLLLAGITYIQQRNRE